MLRHHEHVYTAGAVEAIGRRSTEKAYCRGTAVALPGPPVRAMACSALCFECCTAYVCGLPAAPRCKSVL